MKIFLSLLSILLLLTACSRSSYLSLKNNNKNQVIAFQPLGNYNEPILEHLTIDLRDFYNKQVIILNPVDIPREYYNENAGQYSGDSLIMFLKTFLNDTIVEVVGLIHDPVFTMKKTQISRIDYIDGNLLGIGHQPGKTCLVSDFNLKTEYETLYYLRLRKVVIHEIGHNLGLSHCTNDKCIMSEKNGSVINLDNNGSDYCQKCKKILYN